MTHIETTHLLRSARTLGFALSLIFAVLLIAAGGLLMWLVLDLDGTGQTLAANVGYGDTALRGWQSYALGLILLVQIGIWCAVIWRGREIFTALCEENVRMASISAAQTAQVLWVMLVWGIVAHTLGVLVTTWHFPEGERAVSIAIGSAQISTVFAALLATFTSKAFVLGAELWQDHREVI